MALELLKTEFDSGTPYTDVSDPTYYGTAYVRTRWHLNTTTLLVEESTDAWDDFQGSNPPVYYDRDIYDLVFWDCEGTTRRDYYHDGAHGIRIEPTPNSASCNFVPGLALVSKLEQPATVTDPAHGRLRLEVSGGVGARTASAPGAASVLLDADGVAVLQVPPGPGTATVRDSSTPAKTLEVPFTIGAYVGPTCNNPEADNYVADGQNPDESVCVFSPKLQLERVNDLVALGLPVPVVLHSAEILWAEPAAATCVITLEEQLAGQLTLNGYRFEAGAPTQPGRFEDAETLAEAFRSLPDLEALYTVAVSGPGQVALTARRPGVRFNFTTALSADAAGMLVETEPGQDTYYSERRADWGVWLEVWALPTVPFGPGRPKAGAILAERFEGRYREDNHYSFDIAACLRDFTGLSYDCSNRLTGYFLRFGETYAEQAGGYRRRKVVGESNVLFGLEAVEIVPPATVVTGPVNDHFPYEFPIAFDGGGTGTRAGWRRLSRRPGLVGLGGILTAILQPLYAGNDEISVAQRSATGAVETIPDHSTVYAGQISQLGAGLDFEDIERATYSLGGGVLLKAVPVLEGSYVFTFANGQGGNDSIAFEGLKEPQAKRVANLTQRTGGRATFSAELPDVCRYYSGLLSQAEYEWLLQELGNSPAVWLETAAGPVPVNITDLDASANYVDGVFTLSLEVEPELQPARGVTN